MRTYKKTLWKEISLWCSLTYKTAQCAIFLCKCPGLLNIWQHLEMIDFSSCCETSNYAPKIPWICTLNARYHIQGGRFQCYFQTEFIVPESNTWRVSFSHLDEQKRTRSAAVGLIRRLAGDVYKGGEGQKLTPYLRELIPSVFSGQWLSSDVMEVVLNYEWGTTLWTMRMMQIIHPRSPERHSAQRRDFTPEGWGLSQILK